MPIDDMQMTKQIIVGRVARGYKKQLENGKTVPEATPYFVVKEEIPGLAELVHNRYGMQPEMLRIRFLSNDYDLIFQHFREEYMSDGLGGGKLRCQGDGTVVRFRRFFEPETKTEESLITDQVLRWGDLGDKKAEILSAWQSAYGTTDTWGNSFACLGKNCPRTKARQCRPTGRLTFAIEGIGNLGEWQMRVHTAAIPSIYTQLEKCKEWTEMLLGRPTIVNMPWYLYLGQEQRIRIRGIKAPVKMYPVIIQPDQEWFADVLSGRIQLPPVYRITTEDIWGEREPRQLPKPSPREAWRPSTERPPYEEPILDYDPEEAGLDEIEEEWANGELAESDFKAWLLNRVDQGMSAVATDKQVGYLASMLQTVFGNGEQADVARHQLLEHLFEVKSTKELTKGQASALIEWLKTDEGRTANGAYEPSPSVVEQANSALRAWGVEQGQLEMPM